MSFGTGSPKASEQFRERLVSRYFSTTTDLARPNPGLDITEPNTRRAVNFAPKPSTDTALNAFAELLLLRLNATHALISLIDSSQQYVLAEAAKSAAQVGFAAKNNNALWIGSVVLPRETGLCSLVLPNSAESALYTEQDQDVDPDMVVINDLREDARFFNRPFVVDGPQMRWYAGAPIRSPGGTKLGAVCVFDSRSRQDFPREEQVFLCNTAKTVMSHLDAVKIRSEHQRRDRLIEGLQAFVSGLSGLTSQWTEAADMRHANSDTAAPQLTQGSDVDPTRYSTWWEAALPSGCKSMFSRAANIIRAAGGYDGSAFFYIPSVESSRKSRPRQERMDDPVRAEKRHSPMTGSSRSSSATEDSPDAIESQPDQEPSSGDETGSDAVCPILAFSVTQATEEVRIRNQQQFPRFLVRDMQRLMGRRPRGRVYLLDSLSTALPGDTSSSGSGADNRKPVQNTTTGATTPQPDDRHKSRRAAQVKALLKIEPSARAFVCLPLWDYNRKRWFAFNVCWLLKPDRDLATDQDLKFLQVFSNSITNALAHLDSLDESRAKDSFVSSVSHELRSPLHGILGATNFLYDSSMGRFQREMVDTITSCGRTLLDSLEHVMDFAKINNFSQVNNDKLSKAASPRKQIMESRRKKALAASSLTSSVDISLVIEEVVESVALGFTVQHDFLHSEDAIAGVGVQIPKFNTKPQELSNSHRTESTRGRVRLCLDLPAGNSHFETQPGAWRRIIMNLVGNALKYTDEGSIRISLRVQDADIGSGEQQLDDGKKLKGGAALFLTVRDTGIGMSNEFMQNRIFKAFSQEDPMAVGTGLGLSIVDQVVNSMGGHIEVASARGLGSTFDVHLTLKKAEVKTAQGTRADLVAAVADRLKRLRICVLEDVHSKGSQKNRESLLRAEEHFSQSLIRTLREWFGVEVLTASRWTAKSADLVICLEPSFHQLQSVRSLSGSMTPPVLFIAHDALESAVLRADSRVTSSESFVEITYQP
ncbi:GAF domain-containing protein [Cladophialophora carrionii]|uniref:histidine kinase n=1 Tax=Cladophialophora carrionii TaxID=86049 RepID=A0A1C1CX01_9EURO|nr:GAF domain-containing protein [Cladophialophora carrionii]